MYTIISNNNRVSKKTILVVEDEWPLLNAITKKLDQEGFGVVQAQTIHHARVALDEVDIDAIWLDHYVLGPENGLHLVETVRQHEQHADIPIFVVSNTASSEKVEEYNRLGIDCYFTKSDHRLEDIIGVISKEM